MTVKGHKDTFRGLREEARKIDKKAAADAVDDTSTATSGTGSRARWKAFHEEAAGKALVSWVNTVLGNAEFPLAQ